jgi:hypothetical protein
MGYDTATWIQGSLGIGISIFMIVCFLHGFYNPDKYSSIKIPEYIDTGICMDRNDHSEELKQLRKQLAELKARQVHASNSKNKPKPKPKPKENTLIQDCISALEGLGEKKSVARATVNKYFTSNPDTKSVDEFIAGVFKR